ncbi:uncharacterized protein LOC126298341 [Schistocerca gregaria]|uniref:uncharacterized protein LOC126298341 n=1 Tax=Schistocerca gregaria TaxID=7010 RepID=UPI00211E208D|nr:uncharacterized protein LOC126298341 [Schistocerca gregaria]
MRLAGNVKITDYLEKTLLQNNDSVVSLYSAHGEDFLSVLNPHLKPGLRYKISTENVLQIYVGGMFRDTLTIVLREPPHELRIHNNTLVLERFKTLLRQLCKRVDPSQDENPPAIPRVIENIRNVPQDLTVLKLSNIKMDCLPQSLARLHNVVHLEVVNCNLIKIPVFIGDLPKLRVLVLAHNKLGAQENWDFLSRPHMRQNLVVLNLQDNEVFSFCIVFVNKLLNMI